MQQHRTARSSTARLMADLGILRAVDEAEARGDAHGALDLVLRDRRVRDDEGFWRPEKVRRLLQLTALGPLLPRWATSRWILAQAAQWLDEDSRHRTREAFALTFRAGGFDSTRYAGDLDLRSKIVDHNWVFRQAFLYDLGGLRHFLDTGASADLVAGADRVRDWAEVPLGGYRLLGETPTTVTWFDLRAGEEVGTANLGAASLLEPGEHALGRLVPLRDGRMFESAPLYVPEQVAREVADDPVSWVAALARVGHPDPGDDRAVGTAGHDFALLTDVPAVVEQTMMLELERCVRGRLPDAASLDPVATRLGFVRAAVEGRLPEEMVGTGTWPVVAAAVLDPSAFLRLWRPPHPGDPDDWRRLATRLAAPASDLCRELADAMSAAA